jgi:hypothetical protein
VLLVEVVVVVDVVVELVVEFANPSVYNAATSPGVNARP